MFHQTASHARARIAGTAQSTNARTCYIKVRPFAHGRLASTSWRPWAIRASSSMQNRPTRYEFLPRLSPASRFEKKTGLFGRRGGRSWEGASCAEGPTNHPTVIQASRVRLNSRRRYGNPYRKSHRSMPISVYSLDGSIYLRCCHLTTLDRRDHVRIRNTRHVISHLSDRLARSESMSTTRGSFVQFLLRKGD
jgi:hypothetical protein